MCIQGAAEQSALIAEFTERALLSAEILHEPLAEPSSIKLTGTSEPYRRVGHMCFEGMLAVPS